MDLMSHLSFLQPIFSVTAAQQWSAVHISHRIDTTSYMYHDQAQPPLFSTAVGGLTPKLLPVCPTFHPSPSAPGTQLRKPIL
jgi:hypothetical protein